MKGFENYWGHFKELLKEIQNWCFKTLKLLKLFNTKNHNVRIISGISTNKPNALFFKPFVQKMRQWAAIPKLIQQTTNSTYTFNNM